MPQENIYWKKYWRECDHFIKTSGQRDLNSRPSGPKPDALPDCAMPRVAKSI